MSDFENFQRQREAENEYRAWISSASDRRISIYQEATTEEFKRKFWLNEYQRRTEARIAGSF